MRTVIKSSRIYTEDGVVSGNVIMEDGIISHVNGEVRHDDKVLDFGAMRVIPGIFDTHNHGTHGYSLLSIEEDRREKYIKGFLKGCASQGVTSVFPTCTTDMLEAVYKVSEMENDGAEIVGIQSEGPWRNRVGEKGIKPGWPEVSVETAEKMYNDAGGKLSLVALSPEIPGIQKVIDYFRSKGVLLAFAHSDDTCAEAKAHLANGDFAVVTHIMNAMTGLHHRDVGVAGACLLDDSLYYEIICDGRHLSLEMIEILFRIQDYSKFILVSDCSCMCGAPVGEYKGYNNYVHMGMTLNVTEEGFIYTNTGRILGSTQPVIYDIGLLVEKLNIPLETVVKMSSLNPALLYGIADKKGSLKIGKDADLVIMDDDYKAVQTYVRGKKVYDVDTDKDLFNPEFLDRMKLEK